MNDLAKNIESIVAVCHRLYALGFVAATDGNVSVRLPNGNHLTTRTAINKGLITPADIIEVDRNGDIVHGDARPSTELGMHLFIYSQRPDVNAVVHAHPPYGTGFATARQPLSDCLFPEVIVGLGAIPLAEYATPSTDEVPNALVPFVKMADAVLLSNHGVVTYGPDVWDAFYKMEKVEHAAHITFVARLLGGEKPLTPEQIEKLRAISVPSYGKDFSGKIQCDAGCSVHDDEQPVNDEEMRAIIRKMLEQ
jgi:L-fuculose-phosphate aldolase